MTYPNISACGLEVRRYQLDKHVNTWTERLVPADDLEAYLANAPVVYDSKEYPMRWLTAKTSCSEHTAKLICVQPIVKDTAESILRELIEVSDSLNQDNPMLGVKYFVERARKLLGEG